MTETRLFNTSIFENYANLQRFFSRSNSIKEVLDKKNEPYSDVPIPINTKLNYQWKACQLATSTFRNILAVFLRVIATGLDCCHASKIAKEMKNWSVHLLIGFNTFSNATTTKVSKLISSINSPNKEGNIVNKHPSIPESQVALSVRENTFCYIHKKIKFGHNEGICRGMSFWFLYLYLKTKDQFSDPRTHMAALGEQFKNGGGMDPTLLQSLSLSTGNLLNLKIGTQSNTENLSTTLIQHVPDHWLSNKPTVIQQLKALPTGAYAVGLPVHQTAFIKINNELGYFFDPNKGIIEIQGQGLASKLYKRINHSFKETGNGPSHLTLHIDLQPVTTRP